MNFFIKMLLVLVLGVLIAIPFTYTFNDGSDSATPYESSDENHIDPGIIDALPGTDAGRTDDSPDGSLSVPANVDASFKHHGTYSYLPDHLEVAFDPVDGASGYEILIAAADGSEKTYTVDTNFLMIYAESDDFISGGVSGGSVQVRALGSDGSVSLWSDPEEISHNQIHMGGQAG